MLKSYEAIYEKGRIRWLKEEPPIGTAHIIVTILEDHPVTVKKRTPPVSIAGKGKALGDIVNPIVSEEVYE